MYSETYVCMLWLKLEVKLIIYNNDVTYSNNSFITYHILFDRCWETYEELENTLREMNETLWLSIKVDFILWKISSDMFSQKQSKELRLSSNNLGAFPFLKYEWEAASICSSRHYALGAILSILHTDNRKLWVVYFTHLFLVICSLLFSLEFLEKLSVENNYLCNILIFSS